ncbi:MAG: TIR domain-containing protein [Anaerolineae bacterium]
MSDITPTLSHWNALGKIVRRLPGNLAYYGSALGAIVLAGGGQLPPGLEFVAGSIGGNMMSNMISQVLKDEDLSDDEVRRRTEEAIHKSDIANLLTKQDFLHGYARLIQRLDAQKHINQDILDELRTGFSKVATTDQVEELKRPILQLMQQPPPTAARKVRLFISYARKDDAPFVERLYHDLKDEFDVWWDRISMPNRGLTFLQEIRDAIDWSDRLLLVTGPHAFSSPYVQDEWQHAYETYKGINIALRLSDYPDLPELIRNFDGQDFRTDKDYEEKIGRLREQLRKPLAPIGAFHNVPALPPHFLNSPDALDDLRELVIADVDKPTLISAEKRTTAVEGMGGIGKSVLATAFAHDRKVRFAFPDGIVWLTAGRDAKLYELYRAVGVALGDDLSNYPDETTARQNAQKTLAGKKCLLILDDVWELPVGRAFRDLISGTAARLLITTRNLQINDLLNANEYRLQLINKSQASDYLRRWVGDDPKLDEISEKLGYLFLALKLAGARMKKDNLTGADYLRTFDRVSRMKIDRNATDRDDSLEVSITLGVDAAFAGIEDDRLLYHTFGIFEEDSAIPEALVLQLWAHLRPDLQLFDLQETLNSLIDLALVERHLGKRIYLHDLLHSYTREKLGYLYVDTHRSLLRSYQLPVSEWYTVQDDEYVFENLTFHLFEGQEINALESLLSDLNWIRTKLLKKGILSLLNDYRFQTNKAVDLIRRTLELSAHIITKHPFQLESQLVGRLVGYTENNIMLLLKMCLESSVRFKLLPRFGALTDPENPLIITLAEHFSHVTVLTVTPDSRHLVSGSSDGTVFVWDIEKRTSLYSFQIHRTWVSGISAIDNIRIAVGYRNGLLLIWNLETRTEEKRITLESGYIRALTREYNGRIFVASKWEIVVINLQKGTIDTTFTVHEGWILDLELSLDGKYLFAASGSWGTRNDTISVWSLDSYNLISTFTGHLNDVTNIYPLDNSLLVSLSSDRTVRIWSIPNGVAVTSSLDPSLRRYTSITVLKPSPLLVLGASDYGISIWNTNSAEKIATLRGHTHTVSDLTSTPDGTILISGSYDNTIRFWSVRKLSSPSSYHRHKDRVNSVAISRDNHYLMTGAGTWRSAEDTVSLWDMSSGNRTNKLVGHSNWVRTVAITPDSRLGVSSSYDNTVMVWDLESGQSLYTFGAHLNWVSAVATVSNTLIASASMNTIHIWKIYSGEIVQTLQHNSREINALAVSRDGKLLASGSVDRSVVIWDTGSGSTLVSFTAHDSMLTSLAFDPTGFYLFTSGWEPEIKIWDIKAQKLIATLRDHTDWVRAIAVSVDGKFLISASKDKTIKLWDIANYSVLGTFTGDSPMRGCDISPDNKTIVAGDEAGMIYFLSNEL